MSAGVVNVVHCGVRGLAPSLQALLIFLTIVTREERFIEYAGGAEAVTQTYSGTYNTVNKPFP